MAKPTYSKVGRKRVPRPSRRRILVVEFDDQFVARQKRQYGSEVVDKALEQQNQDLPLSQIGLIDDIEKELKKTRPRLAKDMKQGPRKDVRR